MTIPVMSGKFTAWRAALVGGWIFAIFYPLTWGVMGMNLPTLPPSISQADLYTHYQEHSERIRLAMGLSVIVMPFYMLMSVLVSRIITKIEGPDGVLALVEQLGGALTVVVGQVAGMLWLVAGFRLQEHSPETVRTLYDFGWLFFDMTFIVTTLQAYAMGWAFLADPRPKKLIPGWVAWFGIASSSTFFLLILLPFFTTGPFAWNGLFNYWVTLGSFFVWCIVLLIYLGPAITRIEAEEAAAKA